MIKPEKQNRSSWSESCTKCCANQLSKTTAISQCGDYNLWRRNCMCGNNVDKEMGNEDENRQARLCIERLTNEKDYYRTEYERLLNFFEKLGTSNINEEGNDLDCIACQQKNQMIEFLQKENEVLSKEKFCLMSRLEEGKTTFDMETPNGKCNKASCKRVERERDLLKLDIHRLEEETDCLREKIKIICENRTREFAKFQDQRTEYENVINKLEGERRELIKAQGLRRVTINALEEKIETYTNLLKSAQEEVYRIKTQYCQLKKLHTQCDNALLDTQAQLMEVEAELSNCHNKNTTSIYRKTSRGPNCPCNEQERYSYTSGGNQSSSRRLSDDLAMKNMENVRYSQ